MLHEILAAGVALVSIQSGPILVRGETIGDFSSRVREEITCENLGTKFHDYQATRADLDRNVKDSFDGVSRSLYGWDAELYRIARRGFSYTGALGSYARQVDEYAYNLAIDQAKLQVFTSVFGSKMSECSPSRQ
jgi:hypothetical protein